VAEKIIIVWLCRIKASPVRGVGGYILGFSSKPTRLAVAAARQIGGE